MLLEKHQYAFLTSRAVSAQNPTFSNSNNQTKIWNYMFFLKTLNILEQMLKNLSKWRGHKDAFYLCAESAPGSKYPLLFPPLLSLLFLFFFPSLPPVF